MEGIQMSAKPFLADEASRRRHTRRRRYGAALLVTTALLGTGALLAPVIASSTLPATLDGEVLAGQQPTPPTTDTCTAQGSPGSATYTVTGNASGPYPGTFSADVTIVTTGGHDVSVSEAFRITSGTTTIEGTKTAMNVTQQSETCARQAGGRIYPGVPAAVANVNTNYQALIMTPDGSTYGTTGTSRTTTFGGPASPEQNFSGQVFLRETFNSGGLLLPTTKEQCKDDAWEAFGVFKNQGDCVSFVATGGTNGTNG